MRKRIAWLLGLMVSLHCCSVMRGEDHFLTIGGGESPTNNQVSLEKNVLFLQRFLTDSGLGSMAHDIYFASGKETGRDIQFVDPTTPPPKVNQLLAQIFDREDGQEGKEGKNMSKAERCGFFATSAERMAAGCTSDIEEDNYREYSTYFWAALYGRTRSGKTIERPDYDGDGHVSLNEAHAYVQIPSDTIDIPVATSDIFLRSCSKAEKGKAEMVNAEDDVNSLLGLARPEQRAVIEELSKQLELKAEGRMVETKNLSDKYDKE